CARYRAAPGRTSPSFRRLPGNGGTMALRAARRCKQAIYWLVRCHYGITAKRATLLPRYAVTPSRNVAARRQTRAAAVSERGIWGRTASVDVAVRGGPAI